LVLNAIINQTRPVDKLVVFDDNDEPQDVRNELIYSHFFRILDIKGIAWEWKFAEKKGQHHIHQMANFMGYEWVWRCDDDAIPEPNVLEELLSWISPTVGAVGGPIWTPPDIPVTAGVTGLIDKIDSEPNIQWGKFYAAQEVDHLHCSFLYRAGVAEYNTGLSRVAHREETLFTYELKRKGYDILAVPKGITWHMKNPEGGIRSETKQEMYWRDEQVFRNILAFRNKDIVVLNNGMGDHIVAARVIKELKDPLIFSCYPEIVPGRSIAEAQYLLGDIDRYSVYRKMDQWKWKGSLEDAFRKLYL
jgi:hypothetical protein